MEENKYIPPPVTDRQALNVVRNVLHELIHADAIGPTDKILRMLHERAKQEDSDERRGLDILDILLQGLPRDWQVEC